MEIFLKRERIELLDVVCVPALAEALWRASKGKRNRASVAAFLAEWPERLEVMSAQLRTGSFVFGRSQEFWIYDPKRRRITAPCFEERVVHHALVNAIGPVLDRAMGPASFACRVGKGGVAAVQRAQAFSRRYPWVVKTDVRSFFPSVDHGVLREVLQSRFKGDAVHGMCARILAAHDREERGVGLPIGALTSQHFANVYLAGLDRWLMAHPRVGGWVRYMDDVLVWGAGQEPLAAVAGEMRAWLVEERSLELKTPVFQRCHKGVTFCGVRVFPEAIRLTSRRKTRFRRKLVELDRGPAEERQRRWDGLAGGLTHVDAWGFQRACVRELEMGE